MTEVRSERDLLRWALENSGSSTDSQNAPFVRQNHLMTPDEFKEFMKVSFPDELEILKSSISTLKTSDVVDEIHLALDRILYIVEGIDQADWFADLGGFPLIVSLLDNENTETRRASAWVISNALQNNPKVQQKFMDQIGIEKLLTSFENETEQPAVLKKFGMIGSVIRGFLPLRKEFYEKDGLARFVKVCERFPDLSFRFCWMIGSILDEEIPDDVAAFSNSNIKVFLSEHCAEINDEDILKSVLDRL